MRRRGLVRGVVEQYVFAKGIPIEPVPAFVRPECCSGVSEGPSKTVYVLWNATRIALQRPNHLQGKLVHRDATIGVDREVREEIEPLPRQLLDNTIHCEYPADKIDTDRAKYELSWAAWAALPYPTQRGDQVTFGEGRWKATVDILCGFRAASAPWSSAKVQNWSIHRMVAEGTHELGARRVGRITHYDERYRSLPRSAKRVDGQVTNRKT